MSKEIKRVTKIDNKTFLFETYEKPLREQIQQLKQQLEEKGQEINSLIVDYEKRIGQEQELMSNMEHQLAEKDKEISKLQASYHQLETDRDTWQKACELACDVLRDINYKIYNEDRIDFENTFYQQAKKEGNDEN